MLSELTQEDPSNDSVGVQSPGMVYISDRYPVQLSSTTACSGVDGKENGPRKEASS